MERHELKSVVESLIFVSEEPITLDLMSMVFGEHGVEKSEIKSVIEEIKNDYEANLEKGIHIVEIAGGYQFRTKVACAEWIKKLNVPKTVRLSQPAMETLSIIAYRQPILRSEIENIRGVDTGGVLKTLLEKSLIRIIGKSDEAGNPLVYGTTKEFLEMFGLNSLKELPTLKEIEELEVQERVGDLGKEDAYSGEVKDGVGEVVAEYREEIEAYKPDPSKLLEDDIAIGDLENSMRKLKNLEKDIFPKPTEQLTAVPRETDETEAPQDNSEVDEAFTPEG